MDNYKVGSSYLQSPVGREPASETSGNARAVLVLQRTPAPQQPVSPGESHQAPVATYSRLNTIAGTVAADFLTSSAGLGRKAPHTAPQRLMTSAKATPMMTPVQTHGRGSADDNHQTVLLAHLSPYSHVPDVNSDKLKVGQETVPRYELASRPYTELVRTAARPSEKTLLQWTGYGMNAAPSRIAEKPAQAHSQGRSPFSGPQRPQLHHQVSVAQREQGVSLQHYPHTGRPVPQASPQIRAGQLQISQPVSPQTSHPQQMIHCHTSPHQLVKRQTPHCYSQTELLHKVSGHHSGRHTHTHFLESKTTAARHDQTDLLWHQLREMMMLFSSEKQYSQLNEDLLMLRKLVLRCEHAKTHSST